MRHQSGRTPSFRRLDRRKREPELERPQEPIERVLGRVVARIDRAQHVRAPLWRSGERSVSAVAERKFGPHFVVAKTPIANIRLTTFFAGEAEVRLVDPSQIRVLESVGCTVAT